MVGSVDAEPVERSKLPDYFAALTAGTWPGGGEPEGTPPRFVFTPGGVVISPSSLGDASSSLSDFGFPEGSAVLGTAADGKTSWVAVDVGYGFPCGMEGCDKMIAPKVHGVALFDAPQHALAWSLGLVVAGSFKPGRPSPRIKTVTPVVLATAIDRGAELAVARFKSSLGDTEALAKSVAERKDVVLYGSELAERFIGRDAVRAAIRKWKLGFTVRDGIQAGLSSSKTTAWVAVNVDAAKQRDAKSVPYRVFAVYDKVGADWQLVVLHFSTVADVKQ